MNTPRNFLHTPLVRITVLAFGSVLIFSIIFAFWKTSSEDTRMRKELLVLARTAAQSVNLERLKQLEGQASDIHSPDYIWIKNLLTGLRAGIPKCRFIYLMGRRDDGTIYFFVDSEPAESEDYSPPGQLFQEADPSIHTVFTSQNEAVDGPTPDRWGVWVSAFTPLFDPDTGDLLAVFGMDVDSADWNQRVILYSATPVLVSILLALLLAVAVVLYQQTRREKKLLAVSEAIQRESKEKLDNIINSIDGAVLEFDLQQDLITFANDKCEKLLGHPHEHWMGLSINGWWQHVHPDDRINAMQLCNMATRQGEDHSLEYRFILADGTVKWLRDNVAVIRENGQISKMRCVVTDISDRKDTESSLRKYEHIVSSNPHFMSFIDRNYVFQVVNEAYVNAFGKKREEIVGHTLADLYGEEFFYAHQKKNFDRALAGDYAGYETWFELPLAGRRYMIIDYTPYYDGNVITGVIVSAHDITERKQAEEIEKQHEQKIEHLAYHDALTNLPNRTLFLDRLGQVLAQGSRDSNQAAILFADLDRFKTINDTLGHAVGDELLRHVSTRLREVLREGDTVGRLGGDEFVILLPRVQLARDAAQVAAKSVAILSVPFSVHGHELHVTTSIGISLYPKDGMDAETLLKHADTALYQAKNRGRNQYQFFDSRMNAQAHERLLLENSLRRALDRDELLLYYQPQINLLTNRITGIEALVRWNHPERGMVMPHEFIPIAEETGMINQIAEWGLNMACQQLAEWQESRRETSQITVAVNLSARQLQQAGLPELVGSILTRAALAPEFLELEITESTLMADPDSAIRILQKLHDMGVHITIDDFGTGYSSLAYLKRLPIDRIKIDQSFVRDIPADPNDVAIVESILAIAQKLKLKVLAEGVETEEQKEFLRQRGCEDIQGYLFSAPLSAQDCCEYMEKFYSG